MKGNQGLEALAALCGGQSDVPTEGRVQNRDAAAAPANKNGSNSVGAQHQQVPQDASLQSSQRQTPMPNQQSPLAGLSAPQWQQAIAAISALQNSGVSPSLAQNLRHSGISSQGLGESNFSAMQQYALQQYMQAQAKLSQAQQAALAQSLGAYGNNNQQQALMIALAAGKAQQQLQHARGYEPNQCQQQVIPSAGPPSSIGNSNNSVTTTTSHETPGVGASPATSIGSPGAGSMKPPPPPAAQSTSSTLSTSMSTQGKAPIAPMPGTQVAQETDAMSVDVPSDDKKQQKRAANRKSAQLSRKRKKQFIEELKEENDDLRRKEQILRSIPDLIVVFDSSGKLAFVSQSVSRFLSLSAEQLVGTSFWDRLCGDSVRLLKAAFMDSLAARKSDADSAPLGSGVWELRLVDKDSNYVVVTLNGVVHFTGEVPECVCCIRPRDQKEIKELPMERKSKGAKPQSRLVSSSEGSRTSDDSRNNDGLPLRIRVNPNQSVISSSNDNSEENSAEDDSGPQDRSGSDRKKIRRKKKNSGDRHIRDSYGDSGGEVSESSGSDDGIASS